MSSSKLQPNAFIFGDSGLTANRVAMVASTSGTATFSCSSTVDASQKVEIRGVRDLTGSSADDAVANKKYVDQKTIATSWKEPCRCRTSVSPSVLTNGTVHDGVTVTAGDRVLVDSNTTNDGIYEVQPSGSAVRTLDFANTTVQINSAVFVSEGTSDADKAYTVTDNNAVVGTNQMSWVAFNNDLTNAVIRNPSSSQTISTHPLVLTSTENGASGFGALRCSNGGMSCLLNIHAGGDVTCNAVTTTSDERLKEDVRPVEVRDVEVDWKSFKYKATGKESHGVVAQSLKQSHPELVHEDPDGRLSVDYIGLLCERVARLEAKLIS